jgi:hypothetical protein
VGYKRSTARSRVARSVLATGPGRSARTGRPKVDPVVAPLDLDRGEIGEQRSPVEADEVTGQRRVAGGEGDAA